MKTGEKYTVKTPYCFTFNNNNSIIIELNRGQKWKLVWKNSIACEIYRAGITFRIMLRDFKEIFGEG